MIIGDKDIGNEQKRGQIELLIFDLDGLLIDSEPIWTKADVQLLGIDEERYLAEIKPLVKGIGQREGIEIFKEKCGLLGDVEDLVQKRRELVYSIMLTLGELQTMEGAVDLLKRGARKYVMAVATAGHTVEMTSKILVALGIEDYFKELISCDDVVNGKPAPDVYLAAAEKIGKLPVNSLVFEDAVNGVLAGKAAGMYVIGVNPDVDSRKLLKEAGADEVYSSLAEVVLPF